MACPEGRPVDAIYRIDAIDEVGCGHLQCIMQNAKCTMEESARPPKLASLDFEKAVGRDQVVEPSACFDGG